MNTPGLPGRWWCFEPLLFSGWLILLRFLRLLRGSASSFFSMIFVFFAFVFGNFGFRLRIFETCFGFFLGFDLWPLLFSLSSAALSFPFVLRLLVYLPGVRFLSVCRFSCVFGLLCTGGRFLSVGKFLICSLFISEFHALDLSFFCGRHVRWFVLCLLKEFHAFDKKFVGMTKIWREEMASLRALPSFASSAEIFENPRFWRAFGTAGQFCIWCRSLSLFFVIVRIPPQCSCSSLAWNKQTPTRHAASSLLTFGTAVKAVARPICSNVVMVSGLFLHRFFATSWFYLIAVSFIVVTCLILQYAFAFVDMVSGIVAFTSLPYFAYNPDFECQLALSWFFSFDIGRIFGGFGIFTFASPVKIGCARISSSRRTSLP